MDVSSHVFVLNNDQQFVVCAVLVQEVHRAPMDVAQVQQVFLQGDDTQTAA